MKIKFLLFCCVPVLFSAQTVLTLEDIWGKFAYRAAAPSDVHILKNGQHYTRIEDDASGDAQMVVYDIKSNKRLRVLLSANDLKTENGHYIDLNTFQFSPDENAILFYSDAESIYRHSLKAKYYVYNLQSKILKPLVVGAKQMLPQFSPDASQIAYVSENNLYIDNLKTAKTQTLTTDGAWNAIKNGWADWVYEEEFSKPDYFCWSENSGYLAYVRFDESQVATYQLDFYQGQLYPTAYSFKYPKAGMQNSKVSVMVFNTASQQTQTMQIGTETDIYIPRLQFTPWNNQLCIQRLNRLQNQLDYLLANPETGSSTILLNEHSNTYIDITDDLIFLGNSGFLRSSEISGYNHIYHYSKTGTLIHAVTSGSFDVTRLIKFDKPQNTLYFQAARQNATEREVYRVQLDGSGLTCLTNKPGTHAFEFLSGNHYYLHTYSNANTPPKYSLYDAKGTFIRDIETNTELLNKMNALKLVPKTFFTFKNASGIPLNAWMIKPPDFDSTKHYPVYMYAYNGPGSNECNNAWDGTDYFWHQFLAQQGYIVVCCDGRGTQARGRDFKHATYMQLGKYESDDQLDFASYLAGLKWVDKSRIGFQGWSYGGFMASLMISKGADKIKTAIAVAPVTQWAFYDNVYTERFMRRPQENVKGYQENSPLHFIKNIKGHFLLIHGSADDNVHMQNSMELASAMVQNNIPFDYMVYPNKNHGIYGGYTRLHLYQKIFDFIKLKL